MNVLVIEDERKLADAIVRILTDAGYNAEATYDGQSGLTYAESGLYDLIVLDRMLPGMDGMEVCRYIREFSDVPVIMLTAKGDDMDKILGFENGADDYITKPFNILEVKARIKAILRRNRQSSVKEQGGDKLEIGGLTIDFACRSVVANGHDINLTVKEFDLLELLIKNKEKVYSRESLLNLVWGYEYPGDVRTVDVHVRRLREKIETTPSDPRYVHTKWGVGYYFQLTNK